MNLRKFVPTLLIAALITALPGCKGESKPDANTGPRITSGNEDTESRPQKPSLGGSVKPK